MAAKKKAAHHSGSKYSKKRRKQLRKRYSQDDYQLRKRYSEGDKLALRELFTKHHASFLKLAKFICRFYRYGKAADALADLYVRLAEKSAYGTFDPRKEFRPWARQVLRNVVSGHSRRRPFRYWCVQGKWGAALKKRGVPKSVRAKLIPLHRRRYYNEGEFRNAVEAVLASGEFASYWPDILRHARHGVRLESLTEQAARALADSGRFSFDEIEEQTALLRKLYDSIAQLSSFEQDHLTWRFWDGLTHKVISQLTGNNTYRVHKTLEDAEKKLRAMLR